MEMMIIPSSNKKIIDWHELFVTVLSKNKDLKIIREYQLPSTKIDIVVEKQNEYSHKNILDDYLLKRNVVEFKSFWESLTIFELIKALGKFLLYISYTVYSHLNDIRLFYIVSHYPQKIISSDIFPDLKLIKKESGVYELKHLVGIASVYLIVINQLNIENRTLDLLKFSRGGTKQKFIKFLMDNINEDYYRYILIESYMIDPVEIMQLTQGEVLQLVTVNDNIRYAIESIGIKKVIDAVGIKKVLDEIGLIEVIKEINVHDFIISLRNNYYSGQITKNEFEEIKLKFKEIYEEISKI